MQEENKEDRLLVLAVIAVCISFIVFLIVLYLNSSLILERYELYSSLNVGNVAGIDLNSTALVFGGVVPGSNSGKNIFIENNYNFPVVYSFDVEGNISDFLIFDKKVNLGAGENKTISISTITISDEKFGDYSGFLKVVVKKDI